MEFSYKSPQETLTTALNFDGNSTKPTTQQNDSSSSSSTNNSDGGNAKENFLKRSSANFLKFQQTLKKFNDNVLLYPIVTIFIFTILVTIVLFQKKLSNTIKILFVLIYLLFVVFTVFKFKNI